MRRVLMIALVFVLALFGGVFVTPVWAQAPIDQGDPGESLAMFTNYPAQFTEIGETVTFPLTFRLAGSSPQVVRLEMQQVPEGWTATFRGGGRVIQAVYVQPNQEPGKELTAEVRLEPPDNVAPGTYRFVVVARGQGVETTFPLEITVQEKLPPSLDFDVDLPILKGAPTTTFRYQATLKNAGDEDLTVNLAADAPQGFIVTVKSAGQEVSSLPLKANESKRLDIEARPLVDLTAGQYPITVQAQGSDTQATIQLTADVTGQPELSVTAPEGRLSGQAYAGSETPLKVILQNTGSAPARNIELSSSAPSGWSVEFEPKQVAELAADTQLEVTAKVRPAQKALAGDYMVTLRARPQDGTTKSADFRITVLTSTLWGVAGIALIAVAVLVVGLAVLRFGRR